MPTCMHNTCTCLYICTHAHNVHISRYAPVCKYTFSYAHTCTRAHARTCTPHNLPSLLVPLTLPPGNPSMLCGQRSVTLGAGRHGLAQHVLLKHHCEWSQCEERSISLNSRTHSVYVHRTQPVESRVYCSLLLINFTSHRASAGRLGNVTDIY